METTTGRYINVYKENDYDLYILLNEPNDPPAPDEVDKLAEIVDKQMEISRDIRDINIAIEDSGVHCARYGFRIAR